MPDDRIEADYLIETSGDPGRVADIVAGEQSSGTFVTIPGETPEQGEIGRVPDRPGHSRRRGGTALAAPDGR